jgi:hypothetical protein
MTMLICPFCEKGVTEFHPNSDVVPDWMYKQSFKKNKNLKSYGLDFQKEEISFKQSSFKSSFICWTCESDFGKNEGYARLVFGEKTNHKSIPNIADAEPGMVETQLGPREGFGLFNLNFRKIQKFILGVVLKGHMAKTGETPDLLGEKHFRQMKKIYLYDTQEDDTAYPIFAMKFDQNNPLWNAVLQPSRSRTKEGINIISFRGGGYEFLVSVQSHPLPYGGPNFRFTKKGNFLILKGFNDPKANKRFITDAMKMKKNTGGKK